MKKFLIVVGCILYVLWPIDLIPDFIPVLGWIDDLVAIATGIIACVGGLFGGPASGGSGSGGGE